MRNFSDIEYIKNRPSKEDLKKYDVDKRKEINKQIEKYDKLKIQIAETPLEDKQIIRIARTLADMFSYFNYYEISQFSENLSRVKKAERSILQPKGFTIDDDIRTIIAEYKKDLEKELKVLSFFNDAEHKDNVIKEVTLKKSAMQISGKSIIERVQEFADLNHLLSYKFGQTKIDTCPLPIKEAPVIKKSNSEKEAEALAIALMLELELMEVA